MKLEEVRLLDITAPDIVQIEYDAKRNVLYVHVDGITVLRACKIEQFYSNAPIVEIPE